MSGPRARVTHECIRILCLNATVRLGQLLSGILPNTIPGYDWGLFSVHNILTMGGGAGG